MNNKIIFKSSNQTKSKDSLFKFLLFGIGILFLTGQISSIYCLNFEPNQDDYLLQTSIDFCKQLKSVYPLVQNNDVDKKSFYSARLDRRGGRAPALRLRFGRRSDSNSPFMFLKKNSQESFNQY